MTDIEILQSLKAYTCKPEVIDRAIAALRNEPCVDAISREAALFLVDNLNDGSFRWASVRAKMAKLPLVTPKYTDNEIQKMQDLEQAELEKAYECGKAEQPKVTECDDAISRKAVLEIIEREEFKGDALSEIEKLSSVIPQPKPEKWGMCEDTDGIHGVYSIPDIKITAWMSLPTPPKKSEILTGAESEDTE